MDYKKSSRPASVMRTLLQNKEKKKGTKKEEPRILSVCSFCGKVLSKRNLNIETTFQAKIKLTL